MKIECSPVIETKNSTVLFSKLGINCSSEHSDVQWHKNYHPAVLLGDNSCYGYVGVPDVVPCKSIELHDPDLRRICRCQNKGW